MYNILYFIPFIESGQTKSIVISIDIMIYSILKEIQTQLLRMCIFSSIFSIYSSNINSYL